eukprot:TRINITY_DN66922_c6_g1_i1.p1 TRINITY_DN66922_c6_g1~~TRINITY_DN66922_c6_g1_i1.p1  ORF type:complete len:463 (-),score=18.38 TRINITY_DN66922_c6_g1_i1:531-1919(-)
MGCTWWMGSQVALVVVVFVLSHLSNRNRTAGAKKQRNTASHNTTWVTMAQSNKTPQPQKSTQQWPPNHKKPPRTGNIHQKSTHTTRNQRTDQPLLHVTRKAATPTHVTPKATHETRQAATPAATPQNFTLHQHVVDNRQHEQGGTWEILEGNSTNCWHQRVSQCAKLYNSTPNVVFVNIKCAPGLGDMKSTIWHLANLAAYLCAKIVIGPPSERLSKSHNNRTKLSPNLTWEDFFYTRWMWNNKTVWNTSLSVSEAEHLRENADSFGYFGQALRNETQLVPQFIAMKQQVEKGKPIIWGIYLKPYILYPEWVSTFNNTENGLAEQVFRISAGGSVPEYRTVHAYPSCGYPRQFDTKLQLWAKNAVLRRTLDAPHDRYLTLHLRHDNCQSGPNTARTYIACSFANCHNTSRAFLTPNVSSLFLNPDNTTRKPHVFLFCPQTDPRYRQSVLENLSEHSIPQAIN